MQQPPQQRQQQPATIIYNNNNNKYTFYAIVAIALHSHTGAYHSNFLAIWSTILQFRPFLAISNLLTTLLFSLVRFHLTSHRSIAHIASHRREGNIIAVPWNWLATENEEAVAATMANTKWFFLKITKRFLISFSSMANTPNSHILAHNSSRKARDLIHSHQSDKGLLLYLFQKYNIYAYYLFSLQCKNLHSRSRHITKSEWRMTNKRFYYFWLRYFPLQW